MFKSLSKFAVGPNNSPEAPQAGRSPESTNGNGHTGPNGHADRRPQSRYELSSPLFELDPTARNTHAEGERLRAAGPVVPVNWLGVNMWMVSHHEMVRQVLSDSRFKRNIGNWAAYQRGEISDSWPLMPVINNESMFNLDGQEHRRLRGVVQTLFAPRRIRAMRTAAEEVARDLVSGLSGSASKVIDLKTEFALRVPLRVIGKLYGFEEEDYPELPHLVTTVFSAVTSAEEVLAGQASLAGICADLVKKKRGTQGDDLVCSLLAAQVGEATLTEQEVVDQLFLMLLGGHETTANLLLSAVRALVMHPDQLELARSGEVPWAAVVEETLRWDPPASNVLARFPTEDVEIGGVVIGKGEPVSMAYAAAGRDPRQHGIDAYRFDVTRKAKPHTSFGFGEHNCVGQQLARLDVGIALEELFGRFDVELAVSPDELACTPSLIINGLSELPVRLSSRAEYQKTLFDIPFAPRINPLASAATKRHLEWGLKTGLIRSEAAAERYRSWTPADVASMWYPYAEADDLAVGADIFGWFLLFDDQFDGPLGDQPGETAKVIDMITEVFTPGFAPHDQSPAAVTAFADIWARERAGMSPEWQARAELNWREYLATYVAEADNRQRKTNLSVDEYMRLRDKSGVMYVLLDTIERIGRFEVPASVWKYDEMLEMFDMTVQNVNIVNDVLSLDKELKREDPHNLVLVVEQTENCDRATAVDQVVELVRSWTDRFQQAEASFVTRCDREKLGNGERELAYRFIEGLRCAIRGNYDWCAQTVRYMAADVAPASEPNFLEDLVSPRCPVDRPLVAVAGE